MPVPGQAPSPRRHDRGRGQIRSRTRGQVHPLLSEQVEGLREVCSGSRHWTARWAVARQKRICARQKIETSQLLLTEEGIPFFRRTESKKNRSQIFGNKWSGLIERIRKDHPEIPRYSFTTLRDTAADRIRHIAGVRSPPSSYCTASPSRRTTCWTSIRTGHSVRSSRPSVNLSRISSPSSTQPRTILGRVPCSSTRPSAHERR